MIRAAFLLCTLSSTAGIYFRLHQECSATPTSPPGGTLFHEPDTTTYKLKHSVTGVLGVEQTSKQTPHGNGVFRGPDRESIFMSLVLAGICVTVNLSHRRETWEIKGKGQGRRGRLQSASLFPDAEISLLTLTALGSGQGRTALRYVDRWIQVRIVIRKDGQ